jgi:adenylate kinase
MRMIILGAPGAGKGTQATIISEKFGIPHISTGDIFRENIKNQTELGKLAKSYIDNGKLVPDSVTISIVKDRILKDDCKRGFLFDGFPRTIPQAEALENALNDMGIKLDVVLNIDVNDAKIIERTVARRTCAKCGEIYNTIYKPSKIENICDKCQGELTQRADDTEETVSKRLSVYHEQTEPLIDFYSKKNLVRTVIGKDQIPETTKEVFEILETVK